MKMAQTILIACIAASCGGTSNSSPVQNTVNGNTARYSPTVYPSDRTPDADSSKLTDERDDVGDFAWTAKSTEKKNPIVAGVAILREVRAASHNAFDRVVFEFGGKEMPSYHIEYIDRPVRACGSGDVVPFRGDAWLEVRFSDAQAHSPEGEPTIKDRSRSPNLPVIQDLKLTCDFEAEVTWVIGASSPNRYRLIELTDPTRLVVDIKHN
jgi:hypothetical protein